MPALTSIIGAAAAAEAGRSLFDYNRENFRFDAEMRFERFMATRELAITQMNMYRNDIRKMTELVVTKTNMYTMVGALILAVNIALFCAGRLGLHGQSPPGWIMGLFLTNNAASLAFLSVTIWLCMHASMRATAASAHLLTRKVRLPVPTKRQLDRARKLSSDFEKQSWGDIFRIPFLTRHWRTIPDPWTEEPGQELSHQPRARSVPAAGRRGRKRAPGWVREEWETDRAGTVTGPTQSLPKDCSPEHFRLYARCMDDWWPYDVYARVNLLLGVTCFIQALAYYGLGHINIELRSFWTSYSNPFLLTVAMALLLNFDIRPTEYKPYLYLPDYCEYCGPGAVFPAAIAMSLEFRQGFSKVAIGFAWFFIFIAHGLQIAYTVKLLEVVQPDERNVRPKPEEKLGAPWFPETWEIPSSFQHVLYLVAPPRKLYPGQHDLCRELKEGEAVDAEGGPAAAEANARARVQQQINTSIAYMDAMFNWWQEVLHMTSPEGQREVDILFSQYTTVRQAVGRDTPERTLRRCEEIRRALDEVRSMEAEPIASGGRTGDLSDSSGGTISGDEGGAGHSRSLMHGEGHHEPRYRGYKFVEPWLLTSYMLLGLLFAWCFLAFGNFIEVFAGEQAFLTAPHWARPPMTRPSRTTFEHGRPLGGPIYAGGMQWLPEHMEWYEHSRCEGVEVGIGIEVYYHSCQQTWRRRLQLEERAMFLTWGRRNTTMTSANGAGQVTVQPQDRLADALKKLLSVLPSPDEASRLLKRNATKAEAYQLLDALSKSSSISGKSSTADRHEHASSQLGMSQPSRMMNIGWPISSFDPEMLACGTGGVAGQELAAVALTSTGEGAIFPLQASPEPLLVEKFHLAGLAGHAPILGSTWSLDSGLLLVTRAGAIIECKDSHPARGGEWPCVQIAGEHGAVPVGGSGEKLLAAVGSKPLPGSAEGLRVAFILESSPDMISIFEAEGSGDVRNWIPLGDMPLPRSEGSFTAQRFSIAFVGHDELLIATSSGSACRRRISDGEYTRWDWGKRVADYNLAGNRGHYHGGFAASQSQWRAACGLFDSTQGVVHLAVRSHLRRAAALRPEVIIVGGAAQHLGADEDAEIYYL